MSRPARGLAPLPRTTPPNVRAIAVAVLDAGGVAFAAGCEGTLPTGPEKIRATLVPQNWADTLVLGDGRPVAVRVVDDRGHEVPDASVRWAVAAPAVLGAGPLRMQASAPASESTVNAALDAHAGDSLQVDARRPGVTDVVVTLTDPRFYPTAITRRATVVVAGVRAASARDTTITALGDSALVRGTGLAYAAGTGASGTSVLAVRAGLGLLWTRVGAGAVAIAASGDSVRVVSERAGTDTLVATHPYCLASARCADTVVVHVAQRGAVARAVRAVRARYSTPVGAGRQYVAHPLRAADVF